jgi:transposase
MRQGAVVRRFRALPIGGKPVWIELAIPRLWCPDCGRTRQAHVSFAGEYRRYTHQFERYVLDLSARMTIRDVARHLGVGWDLVKEIQKRYLQRRFAKPKLKGLRRIAIDEICIGHGHRYLTVVLDLASGAVVFVGNGKEAESLDPFWKALKRSRAKIEAVATDMSPAYILAVRENLPKAVHVFDRFHVVKLVNEKLADLRRQVQNSVEQIEHKKLIKGTLWLLLKNPDNLDPEKDEPKRLAEALRINQPLATAYYLKEDLRQFWECSSKTKAECFLDRWINRAQTSGIQIMKTLAKTLQQHRKGLLAWYDCPISTAALEGTNNKIKTMQRKAYGYRDQEFFRLKIFALHETRYELVG